MSTFLVIATKVSKLKCGYCLKIRDQESYLYKGILYIYFVT